MVALAQLLSGLNQGIGGGLQLGMRGQQLAQAEAERQQQMEMMQQQQAQQAEQQRLQQFQMLSEAAAVGKDYFSAMAEEMGVDTKSKRFKALMKSAVANEDAERERAQMFLGIARQSGVPLADIFDPEAVPPDVLSQGIMMASQLQRDRRQSQHDQARLRLSQMQEQRLQQQAGIEQQLLAQMQGGGGRQTAAAMSMVNPTLGKLFQETSPQYQEEVATAQMEGQRAAQAKQPLSGALRQITGLPKLSSGKAAELGVITDADPKALQDMRVRVKQAENAQKDIDALAGMINASNIGLSGRIARTLASYSTQIQELAQQAGVPVVELTRQQIMSLPGAQRSSRLGEEAQKINSRVVDLAYSIATAREGGRLTEQDVARALETMGQSGDPEVFRTSLMDLRDRLGASVAAEVEGLVGLPALNLMPVEDLVEFSQQAESDEIKRLVLGEIRRRRNANPR